MAAVIVTVMMSGGIYVARGWRTSETVTVDPWYAPYVDVTATPRFPFEQIPETTAQNVVLSFIVSDPENACTPTWGGFFTVDEASNNLDLDRRIALYRQNGGEVSISFGGQLNNELAVHCADESALLTAYKTIIDRYQVSLVDFDIEGEGLLDKEATIRRAKVLAQLQDAKNKEDEALAIWLTLPVAPSGLTDAGHELIAEMLAQGVDIAGINVMAMNYGQSKDVTHSMAQASEMALIETHRQLGILYDQAGISLNDSTLWKKMGVTPMIGQNEFYQEIFTLVDAKTMNEYAFNKNIARISMWSLNRDVQCGGNYANLTIVSNSCSGVNQKEYEFSQILSKGYDGLMSKNANVKTTNDPIPTVIVDDPSSSPYPIWSEEGVYLKDTKIVWHGNVYQAKWWTKGDLPDNPVLQTWETPWQLLGPVLPGEEPVVLLTLPEGTYSEWSGTTIYTEGDRVLFDGIAFQAKWWTQGDSPAAASINPDSSPWLRLTQEQIKTMLEDGFAS